jgi:1,4-dihydroxy-2-naphthoyl-CoA hydrolase
MMTRTDRGGTAPLPADIVARVNERLSGTFAGFLGLEVTEVHHERVQAHLKLRPEHMQSRGIVHGGALMTLADTVAGIGAHVNSPPDQPSVTVELKINLVSAARGGTLRAEALPVHRGRTTSVWETRLTDEGGTLIAVALSTHMTLDGRPRAGSAVKP